jgi:hypothetical protein
MLLQARFEPPIFAAFPIYVGRWKAVIDAVGEVAPPLTI